MIRKVLLVAALVGAPVLLPSTGYAFHGHGGVGYVDAMLKGDDIVIKRYDLTQETRQRTKKVKGPEGTFREVTETYAVFVPHAVQQKFETDKVKAFDHEGKSVDAQTLAGRLEKFTPVLVSHNAQPVDPAYFTMLKKGALVLVLPKIQYPAPKPAGGPKEIVQVSFGDDDELPRPKKNAAPAGLPPSHAAASIDAKGMIHIQESSGGSEPMEMEVEIDKDGVKEKAKIVVKNTYFSMNKRSLEARWVKAHDVSGKDIDAKTLASRLSKHTNVLVSLDGKKVDPYYLQLYKEGTIVLMPPSFGYYGGTVVVPAPAGVAPKSHDDDDFPPPKKSPPPKVKTPPPIEKFPPPPKEIPKKLPKEEKTAAEGVPAGSGPVFAAVLDIGPDELTYIMTQIRSRLEGTHEGSRQRRRREKNRG